MDINGLGGLEYTNNNEYTIEENKTDEFKAALQKAYDENDKEKLEEVCQQFESLFIQMMYKQMRATVPESELIEKSQATEIFEEMLDEELANTASKRGIGIADMMYKQLVSKMDKTYKSSNVGSESTFDQKK